jgi:putative holliday junction resolvase
LERFLSIDYGQKVVGLATFFKGCDPYPTPFGRVIYKSDDQVIKELELVIKTELIDTLVVGIPYYLDGNSSKMTEIVKRFGERLQLSYPDLRVFFQDETLSSFEAEDRMKKDPRYNFKVNSKEIDALAASIILEDFLREKKDIS